MSVLGTTVFKVPELGELGYKLDQANEAKIKAARQQIEKTVQATGAEKAYADQAMGLTGRYKQIADASYDVFRQAAIRYEQTGNAKDEMSMRQAASQLNFAINSGSAWLKAAGTEYFNNKSEGFKNTSVTPQQAGNNYANFINSQFKQDEIYNKNGVVYVKDGDAFIPAVNSTYLQTAINPNNSFVLPRVVTQGKYVAPEAFVNDFRGAITAGESEDDAVSNMYEILKTKVNDRAFLQDVMTSYGSRKLGLVSDPTKIDAETYNEIQQMAQQDEDWAKNALEWYVGQVLEIVPPLWNEGKTGNGNNLFTNLSQLQKQIYDRPLNDAGKMQIARPDGKSIDVNLYYQDVKALKVPYNAIEGQFIDSIYYNENGDLDHFVVKVPTSTDDDILASLGSDISIEKKPKYTVLRVFDPREFENTFGETLGGLLKNKVQVTTGYQVMNSASGNTWLDDAIMSIQEGEDTE